MDGVFARIQFLLDRYAFRTEIEIIVIVARAPCQRSRGVCVKEVGQSVTVQLATIGGQDAPFDIVGK